MAEMPKVVKEIVKKRNNKLAAAGTTIRDMNIAKERAAGLKKSEICRNHGLSRHGLDDILNRPDVKKMIETELVLLAQTLPAARDNYDKWIRNAHQYQNPTDKEIGFKATTKVLEQFGVLSDRPSVVVNNIINAEVQVVPPIVRKMLDNFLVGLKQFDAIDAEFEEVKDDQVPN